MKNSVVMVTGKVINQAQRMTNSDEVRFSVQGTGGRFYVRVQNQGLKNVSLSLEPGQSVAVFGYLESVYSRRCNSPHAYIQATNIMPLPGLDFDGAVALVSGHLHGYSRRLSPDEGRFSFTNPDGLFFGRVYGEELAGMGQLLHRGDAIAVLGHLESQVSKVCDHNHMYLHGATIVRSTRVLGDLWDEVGIPFLLWGTHLIEHQDDPMSAWWGGWDEAAIAFLAHQVYRVMETRSEPP